MELSGTGKQKTCFTSAGAAQFFSAGPVQCAAGKDRRKNGTRSESKSGKAQSEGQSR
jgi:hypothetical protein